ncbi:MAG: hypothetical protein ACRC11_14630, partial [Xenococcaceae cyanobacterium]
PYTVTILRGKTKPSRTTWWIWTIVGFLLVASYYSSEAINTIWVPVCVAIGHLIIAILSIKYGEGGWKFFDRLCILGTGMSLILWWRYDSPLIALLLNIVIDFLGALPTLVKSYYKPETEDPCPWIIFLAAHTLNLFALNNWSFKVSVYPLYLFCVVATIVILLLGSHIRVKLTLPFYKSRKRNKKTENRRGL